MCPSCGLRLEDLDQAHGEGEVVLDLIHDAARCFSTEETEALRGQLARFARRLPRHFLAIHAGAHDSAAAMRTFGFWLLNRAALPAVDVSSPNENGLLLLLDPARGLAGLVVGYQLEPWLPEPLLARLLEKGRRDFQRGRSGAGAAKIIAALEKTLRHAATHQQPPPSAPRARLSPLAGLRRLRGRFASASPPSSSPASGLQRTATRGFFVVLLGIAFIHALRANPNEGDDDGPAPLEESQPLIEPDPLVLPQWTAEEHAALENGRPPNLGGGLWNTERYPLLPAPPWPASSPQTLPTPAPGVLPWELLSACGAAREWCVDPQRLLPAAQRAMIETHLATHARASAHPLRLWILAPGQALPPALDDATLHRNVFGPDQPGLLAIVAAEEPAACRLTAPPSLGVASPSSSLGQNLTDAVNNITPGATPALALEELALWLSLELRSWPALATGAEGSLAGAAAPLPNRSFFASAWPWLAAAAGVGALAWRARQWLGLGTARPVILPEQEILPRLGAPHSGGSGAVISW